MKKNTAKTKKKNHLTNRKISAYFTRLPTHKPEDTVINQCKVLQERETILEPITNLPQCSTTPDLCPRTPESAKRKLTETTPSPDFIPSSHDYNRQPKRKIKNLQRTETQGTKTPRKSPSSKLFHKSPQALHTFNVEVLEKFVGFSTAAQKGASAQNSNESTPTKLSHSPTIISPTQMDRVRTKLSFSPKTKDENMQELLNDSWEEETLHLIDLERLCRCQIVTLDRLCDRIRLSLTSVDDNATGVCIIEGFWCGMKMERDDIVCVSATYNHQLAAWHICNAYGLIVYEPDYLVSSTSVVGARFCLRRNVLSEYYRGFEPSNRVMIIGVLIHQLFQDVLRKNTSDVNVIKEMLRGMILEKDTVRMLYDGGLDVSDVVHELTGFVPRIIEFMLEYVVVGAARRNTTVKDNWKGNIDNIQDIEENIWCPELGLKGKVDVSLLSDGVTYPLELKTGRATSSIEHRGQVTLYVMMMNQLGYNVPSGLLLYLREGVMREVAMGHAEKRDLVLLRNELTYYLRKLPEVDGSAMELPEPVNHHKACSTCPYNIVCCSYLRYGNVILHNNPLTAIQEDILSHLQPQHLAYFIKWSSLLRLEASCTDGNKQVKEIYTVPPEKREENGQCVIQLKIKDVDEHKGAFEHTFEKADGSTMQNSLGVGDYVVVSTDTRPAVSSGLLTHIDHSSVTLNLDRDLRKRYANATFHLDTYNSSISQTFNMASLSMLLEASEQAAKLRRIIIDKTAPTFETTLSKTVAIKGVPVLRRLNKNQQRAILKALSCNDYLLIKGMPGTGKTATIVALIQILVELNKTILITSHTHSAVDNVCLRLQKSNIKLLRLGSDTKINPKLHNCSEKTLTQGCTTLEELDRVYNGAQVVAITCLGCGHPILNKRTFDVCLVDESTQILQCSVIRALHASRKFILIGDPDQLPPIVRSREAVVQGLSESLFERLDAPTATVSLAYNYRMNQPITDMANALTYNGELLTANDDVSNATLHLPQLHDLQIAYKNAPWILETLDPALPSAIKILDTGPVWMNSEASKVSNQYETAIVVRLIEALLKGGAPTSSIGVIAPFRVQVELIKSVLQNKDIEVSTVDQYQGRDKEVVIYSCTKSAEHLSLDIQHNILEDKRRLTVAITRAKHKFILIGDLVTVRRYSPFSKLLNCLDQTCFVSLRDCELGFK